MSRLTWLLLLVLQGLGPIMVQQYDQDSSDSSEVKDAPPGCDVGKERAPHEGNLGPTNLFPWIGVIKVHIHSKDTLKIALTGIVLVKRTYAIGNADDISRIPKSTFKEHTSAMFLAKTNDPWYCKLHDYMLHPEYEYATLNTIALVELESGNDVWFPMMPICWPSYSYNASKNLFTMGFQDDNKVLEKTIFALEYVDSELCEEFYNRVGYKSEDLNTAPTHLLCGFAPRNKNSCIWDNGMALASNTTGSWMLLGLGVRGPGCAAPARFIEMIAYLPWINSAIGVDEIEDQMPHRRHTTRTSSDAHETPFVIDRYSRSTIYIRYAADSRGVCYGLYNEPIFHEKRKLTAPILGSSILYKISIQAPNITNKMCCRITLTSKHQDTAAIYTVENEAELKITDELKIVNPPENAKVVGVDMKDWEPWIKAEDIYEEKPTVDLETFDTILRLEFKYEAEFEVDVFRPSQRLKPSERRNASETEINTPEIEKDVDFKIPLKSNEDTDVKTSLRNIAKEISTKMSMEIDTEKKEDIVDIPGSEEVITKISLEADIEKKENIEDIPGSEELIKKTSKPIHMVDRGFELGDKNKEFKYSTEPFDMDLRHYDAIRLPESADFSKQVRSAVDDYDDTGETKINRQEKPNKILITEIKDVKVIIKVNPEINKVNKTYNKQTEKVKEAHVNNPNESIQIDVTRKIEPKSMKLVEISEKTPHNEEKPNDNNNLDSVDTGPKESALLKGLVNGELSSCKSIGLGLIFLEVLVLLFLVISHI